MAKYLALIYDDETKWGDTEQRERGHAAHVEFGRAHAEALRGGAELAPSDDAITARVADDGTLTLVDGAFAEAKEVLGGYYILSATDREAAARIAAEIPVLDGCVVIREVVVRDGSGSKFMALLYDREVGWRDPSRAEPAYQGHRDWMAKHADIVVDGQELAPGATATTIRVDDSGGVTYADGAFAEAKEVLGGFYAFEADDLDAALAIARDVPVLAGAVELRPTGHMTDA